ncbi:DUF4236 domain-containing protein [Curtobacterium sp. VKM Ac-1376]|uniref:DUF4236 domain-containing protein n=1 Tax=Curtobacterium sp. VKM Ac-1376 TaxID=123312 RepID=UPI00188D6DD7|nr:DUF4236 domain-containing protein [Curtobacterium sp. VKM Ac-1376]MBF4613282.1 DUF4236 domain-containing protein [Curtobacterium sp. VKM Ac-1376]
MGFSFRKSVRAGKGFRINLSNTGVSASKRVGRVSVSTRGRVSVRLFPGFFWRSK